MKKIFLVLSLLAFTSCVAVGPRCTYTQEGTKLSSWIWFTKEIPVDLSKDNCNQMELGKARSTEEIIKDIKATLESKVKDNVATHGGEINFLSYDQGIVRLQMAGACSGCAMSKKTLHEGVERLLIHYVPEVRGLLGEDDEEAKHKGYSPYFPKEVNV